jgi:hypothetical protein
MSLTTLAITALGIVAAALLAVFVVVPDKAHVERSLVVMADPATVYPIVSSTSGFNRFNPFRAADPTLTVSPSGPERGVGASFSWEGKSGKGTQTISAVEEGRRVVMQRDLGSMGRPVQTFTLEPVGGGTRVTWALDASFGANPVARVFGLFMDRMLGPTYEQGLAALADVAKREAEARAGTSRS